MTQIQQKNPLGTDKISVLTGRFAVPSIIAMQVSAVYNIADPFFVWDGDTRIFCIWN